jgi:hypothetical protein
MYQAETASAMQTKEDVTSHNYYASLYKAQKTVELLKENQKSATTWMIFLNWKKRNLQK